MTQIVYLDSLESLLWLRTVLSSILSICDYWISIRTKEQKRERQKKAAEAAKKYDQYNWHAMFNDGSLRKETNAVLDKYLKYHHLPIPSNKRGKVNKIQEHILTIQRTQNATVQGQEKASSSKEDDNREVSHNPLLKC